MRLLGWGVALTLGVTGVLVIGWGRAALVPGVVFGSLATAIQVVAWIIVRPVLGAPFASFLKRWGVGMGLRLAGVALFAVAVMVNRELFPPLPTAFAYVGVLIPLLFMETRWLR